MARSAAKFYAKPTDAMTCAISDALGKSMICSVLIYDGLVEIAPPFVPTAIGSSRRPLRTPYSIL